MVLPVNQQKNDRGKIGAQVHDDGLGKQKYQRDGKTMNGEARVRHRGHGRVHAGLEGNR